jgi:uncharacterized repeat protein (TIGR01451 family)
MGKIKAIAFSVATSAVLVSLMAAPTAFAWHPEGKIVKKVQNVTAKSELSDANDEKSAISAKTGDILTYVITVSNAQTNDDGKNDMTNTILTDTLPEGVELVSNASQRIITENLGTIKPKQSVTKQYQVKVTATTDGKVITNKACFTGNTAVNDNPQSGCEVAVVKVSNPTPEQPKPPVTPPTTTTPETPKTEKPATTQPEVSAKSGEQSLPQTGPASTIAIAAITVVAGYVFYMKRLARKN